MWLKSVLLFLFFLPSATNSGFTLVAKRNCLDLNIFFTLVQGYKFPFCFRQIVVFITRSSFICFIVLFKRTRFLLGSWSVASLRLDFFLKWPNTLIALCYFALKNMFWLGYNPTMTSTKRCSFSLFNLIIQLQFSFLISSFLHVQQICCAFLSHFTCALVVNLSESTPIFSF